MCNYFYKMLIENFINLIFKLNITKNETINYYLGFDKYGVHSTTSKAFLTTTFELKSY